MGPATKFRNVLFLAICATGCDRPSPEQAKAGAVVNVASGAGSNLGEPREPVGSPNLPPERETIDPQSPAAAGELVVGYFRLLQKGRQAEARGFWDQEADANAFEAKLAEVERLQARVGEPGEPEGAAGSIYVEVPVWLAGQSRNGSLLDLAGSVVLRRVNNVPGSTEAQRRWHIFRADLQPRP